MYGNPSPGCCQTSFQSSLSNAFLLHALTPCFRRYIMITHSKLQSSSHCPFSMRVIFHQDVWFQYLTVSQQGNFLQGRVVNPTPNPQPGGQGHPSQSVTLRRTCPARVILPVAKLPPTQLLGSSEHSNPSATLRRGYLQREEVVVRVTVCVFVQCRDGQPVACTKSLYMNVNSQEFTIFSKYSPPPPISVSCPTRHGPAILFSSTQAYILKQNSSNHELGKM